MKGFRLLCLTLPHETYGEHLWLQRQCLKNNGLFLPRVSVVRVAK